MTKDLNDYARKADGIARNAFAKYRKAEKIYQEAEKRVKEYPERFGVVSYDYQMKSMKAKADLQDAKELYKTAKREFENSKGDMWKVRKELAAEIEEVFSANPDHVDRNTVELLKSGIVNADEYQRLIQKAKADGNPTMTRLIGKYAGIAAKERSEKYGDSDAEAQALRVVEYDSRLNTGEEYLESFDNMIEIYNKCVNNPGIIDHWDEFTGGFVNGPESEQ